jgi:hypothetical protein
VSAPILQRKPAAKRAFYGMAGSPLSRPVEPPLRFLGAVLMQLISFDASLLHNGGPSCPMFTMTAAAIRAAKWREKQRQADPNFNQREAKRKAAERAEEDRIQEIEDELKVNPNNQNNVPFPR